ncbi:MAG: hypothetical protein LBJ14_06390 [Desulfarculales bacterium]|nr:hypothetical protein [Desulfarculales bacterium]
MTDKTEQILHKINSILSGAFFAPLNFNDWLGFHFNQPFLLSLAPDELKDLFARCALADQRLNPQSGLEPLARLIRAEDPVNLLAQALASLKDDRPFLLHRTLSQLPALSEGELDPDDFEDLESMLEEALQAGLGLGHSAGQEIKNLRAQALSMLEPADNEKITAETKRLLTSPMLREIQTESQLRLWISSGGGAEGIDQNILPHVLVETWTAWSGAITGADPSPELLCACRPGLRISEDMLNSYLPPAEEDHPHLSATCPYCQGANVIQVDEKQITTAHRCPHLIFIGTNDPLHLLRVLLLAPAEMGEDVVNLLDSYYNSPSDHGIFATFICDLYQQMSNQDRLKEAPVSSIPSGQPHASLRAYFTHPSTRQMD